MASTNPGVQSASTADLVRRLIENVQALVNRQIALVKQEIREDIGQVAGAAKTLVVGLALLMVAGLCFLHFLFLAIDTLLPRWGWLAALALTLLFAALGVMFAIKGKNQVRVQMLARTRETLKEDAEWARHRLTPNGRSNPSGTTSPPPSRSSSAEPEA